MMSKKIPQNYETSFEISQLSLILRVDLSWYQAVEKANRLLVNVVKNVGNVNSCCLSRMDKVRLYLSGKPILTSHETLALQKINCCSVESGLVSRPQRVQVMSATDKVLFLNNKQCQTESRCHGDVSRCLCGDVAGFASLTGRRSVRTRPIKSWSCSAERGLVEFHHVHTPLLENLTSCGSR